MTGVRCEACGATFQGRAWRSLRLVRLLGAADLRHHVTVWAEGAVVEVRSCGHCAHAIARLQRAEGSLAP